MSIKTFKTFKTTTVLALPMLFAHVIEGFFPFVNTLLSARLGQEPLAAAGLVGAFFICMMGFGWGVTTSVGIMVSHHLGASRPNQTGHVLKACFVFCGLFSIVAMTLFWNMKPILLAFGQDPVVVEYAAAYFAGLAFGLPADFGKFAIFQYLAAYDRPRVAVITHLISLPLLIGLNICLIWGYGPFPELGMFGIGIGTAITYWFAFIAMLLYVLFKKPYCLAIRIRTSFNVLMSTLKEMWKLGAPIGLMFLIEITLFMVVALMMGHLGTATLAAHQIALQMLGITILFAFGFAEAVTILVGRAAGAKNLILAREVSMMGMSISLIIMILVALAHWLLPETIIGIDLDVHDPLNEEVVAFAIGFLMLSGLFQLFDSARLVVSGALRGLKDSQYPMWVSLITFWFIGLPIGYVLAFYLDWGGMGLWAGLIAAVALSLGLQFRRLMKQLKG